MKLLSRAVQRALWVAAIVALGAMGLYQRTELRDYPVEVWMCGLGLPALRLSETPGRDAINTPTCKRDVSAFRRQETPLQTDTGVKPTVYERKFRTIQRSDTSVTVDIPIYEAMISETLPDGATTTVLQFGQVPFDTLLETQSAQVSERVNEFAVTGGNERPLEESVEGGLEGTSKASDDQIDEASAKSTTWNSSIVIVPTVFTEWDNGWPAWTENRTVYLYQRTDPSASRFCKNTGHEAGVILRFIVDFYDDLPDRTVFLHSDPAAHQPDFERWIDCLSPGLTFTSLNTDFFERRSISLWWRYYPGFPGAIAHMERCWRALARAFNKTLTAAPAQKPVVSCYCCQQVAMSRAHIRRQPLSSYQRAYEMIGLQDRCVNEPTDPFESWSLTQPYEVVGGHADLTPEWYESGMESKLTQAMSMEHLIHFLLNDEPLESAPYSEEQYCRNFLPSSQCKGSPCPR